MSNKFKLAIAIPTYNRAETLDFFFKVHISRLEKYDIPIFLSNNCSIDNTESILNSWKERYKNIFWINSEETVHADHNVQKALEFADAEYVWLLGDSYEIPIESIELVISFLSMKSPDIVLLNLSNKHVNNGIVYYNDKVKFAEQASYLVTCLSCLIFNKSLMDFSLLEKHRYSDFGHFGYVLDYICKVSFEVSFLTHVNVVTLKTPKRKEGWSNSYLEILFNKFPSIVHNLCNSYPEETKIEIIKNFVNRSGLLSFRNLLSVRSKRGLTIEYVSKYLGNMNKYLSVYRIILIKIVSLTPTYLCFVLVSIIEFYRRYYFKLCVKVFKSKV